MTAPVVDGICRILAAAGLGDYATDRALDPAMTPITVGASPATDGPSITVTTYSGGAPPDAVNGWEHPRVQVRVRDTDPLQALQMDRDAYLALQFGYPGNPPRFLPESTWWLQDCYALQSEAQPLGIDANDRHEYVRNYQLTVESTE